ncbi:hypothetical protein IW262DRAFT_1294102 [Armillaria fumosa]|nr:hypothetical protein IW262DRAFT_1294102 [Armillaria fumosa]
MDKFYNAAKAKDTIQMLLEESTKTNKYHLSRIIKRYLTNYGTQEGLQMMNVSLQKDNDDFVWCLVKGVAEETEELIFTVKEGGQYKAITFNKDIDPVGILQWIAKTDMAHTEDNKVQYFKANVDDEGKWRIGNIVEVQCSIIIFKARGVRHKMKLVLRAIAMLDCNMTLDTKQMSSKCSAPEETGPKQLKRKIGFTDEDNCDDVATK